jgi:hypothetical protein
MIAVSFHKAPIHDYLIITLRACRISSSLSGSYKEFYLVASNDMS